MNAIHRRYQSSGFTIVEMIGVLAVIAVLASLLIPRVQQAMEEQKGSIKSTNGVVVNSTVVFTNDRSVSSEIYGVLWVTNCTLVTNPITGQHQFVTNVVPIVSRFRVHQDDGGTNISLIRSQ